MTSRERALRAIRHQRPDRVPVIPQAHIWAEYAYGSSSVECMYDGERYAEVQLRAWHDFGWDGIFVATDSVAIAHSLGLEVHYTDVGAAPGPRGLCSSLQAMTSLTWPDPRETRLNEWIVATRRLMREVGDRVLIIARADVGAFSLAAQLRGMQEWLLEIGLAEDPPLLHAILTQCSRYSLRFIDLLLETGAPVVTIGDGLASGSVVSPQVYERYVFPYHHALAQAIRRRNALLSIHVCGDVSPMLSRLVDTGTHILEFDAPTDFDLAWRAARGKTCLLGNVPVSEVMTRGSPEQVEAECRWRLEKVKPASGYILSSGCALSPDAPAANLMAMVESAKRYGRYDAAN
jgi:MtaA/CmuA family methyltransferase